MPSLDDLTWVEAQASAHIGDWLINERRMVNFQDPDTRALIDHGLLVIVDDETRALLPPPATAGSNKVGGCGCG